MLNKLKPRENKDKIFEKFLDAVVEISQEIVPKNFLDIASLLGKAVKYFPEDQQGEIQSIYMAVMDQYSYVLALDEVRDVNPTHEQREKKISEFLAKYHL